MNNCKKMDKKCEYADRLGRCENITATCSRSRTMCDLISRQAAIDAVKKAYWDSNLQSAKDDPCVIDAMTDWAIRQVKALPSAQPQQTCEYWDSESNFCTLHRPSAQPTIDAVEVKHGEWIKLDIHAHLADHKCTACGQECYVPTCMGEPMYTYCPNCGAKMDGEVKNNEQTI